MDRMGVGERSEVGGPRSEVWPTTNSHQVSYGFYG